MEGRMTIEEKVFTMEERQAARALTTPKLADLLGICAWCTINEHQGCRGPCMCIDPEHEEDA